MINVSTVIVIDLIKLLRLETISKLMAIIYQKRILVHQGPFIH